MAVDPEQFEAFRARLEEVADTIPASEERTDAVMERVLGPAFGEFAALVEESRPPRLYVFGRSGAGKSSLINALARREVAEVGAVEPTTRESRRYEIDFPDRHATWEVVDSRGLFESVAPDGSVPADTVAAMRDDLETHRPDVLIHVVTPDGIRAGERDFAALERLRHELDVGLPPIVYCLNKVDTHLPPGGEWPPETNSALANDIGRNLDFVARVLGERDPRPIGSRDEHSGVAGDVAESSDPTDAVEPAASDPRSSTYGYAFDSDRHVGVVPVYLGDRDGWNVETLAGLIADHLPADARLQFGQAAQREAIMRRLARRQTDRFARVAGGVGALPTGPIDLVALAPVHLALVGVVGTCSCRALDWATVREYLDAVGMRSVAGHAARELVRSLVQFAPGTGQVVSGTAAAGHTWAVGRSAEAYFFDGEIVTPGALIEEGTQRFRQRLE